MKKFMKSVSVLFLLGVFFMSTVQACFANGNLIAMANFSYRSNQALSQSVDWQKETYSLEQQNLYLEDYFQKVWVPGVGSYWKKVSAKIGYKDVFVQKNHDYFVKELSLVEENRKLANQIREFGNFWQKKFLIQEIIQNLSFLEDAKTGHEIFRKSQLLGCSVDDPRVLDIPIAPSKLGLSFKIVEITQTLYMYENGQLIFSTPVTTGKNGMKTPKGKYYIRSTNLEGFGLDKERQASYRIDSHGVKRFPADASTWNNKYGYDPMIGSLIFLRFTVSGAGIHDADTVSHNNDPVSDGNLYWRLVYGGSDYTHSGSHGCVNTPLKAVNIITKKVKEYYNEEDFIIVVEVV